MTNFISKINNILEIDKHPMKAILDLLKKEGYDDSQIKECLDSIVNADLMIDTGDGECDFTYNTFHPSPRVIDRWDYSDRTHSAPLNNKASIVWLAKQQGYTKEDLKKHLFEETYFSYCLGTITDEVQHQSHRINPLWFTMGMKFKDLILISELKYWHEETGKWGGYLIIGNDAVCGFYDPDTGIGSLMGIGLEKDVKLPMKYLSRICIDDKEYSDSMYNYWEEEDFWENHSLMRICAPRGFKKIMAESGYNLKDYSEIFEKK